MLKVFVIVRCAWSPQIVQPTQSISQLKVQLHWKYKFNNWIHLFRVISSCLLKADYSIDASRSVHGQRTNSSIQKQLMNLHTFWCGNWLRCQDGTLAFLLIYQSTYISITNDFHLNNSKEKETIVVQSSTNQSTIPYIIQIHSVPKHQAHSNVKILVVKYSESIFPIHVHHWSQPIGCPLELDLMTLNIWKLKLNFKILRQLVSSYP